MPTARYKFFRDTSMRGFLSGNRASTDAINAVSDWSNAASGRSYELQSEADETVVVDIMWSELDDTADVNLDDLCRKCGVTRSCVQPA